jgi:hypothetical protein
MRRGFAVAVCAALIGCQDATPPSASKAQPLGLPTVVLLATIPGSTQTDVVSGGEPIATIRHAPHAEARGALLPDGRTLVAIVDLEQRRDLSWASSLVRIEPGQAPVVLVDRVAYASRPLVLADGRVVVQRGFAGAEPAGGDALRADEITLEAVDPWSGGATQLHGFVGYTAHVAGARAGEVIVYRVSYRHADLVAIDLHAKTLRMLAEIPPFARDFSVDDTSLVYANRDSAGWLVERLHLTTLARSVVARADAISVTPHVWRGGSVLVNDGQGVRALDGSLSRPMGPGFDELRVLTPAHAAFLHLVPGRLPVPFVVTAGGSVSQVPAPPGARVDIAGVLP